MIHILKIFMLTAFVFVYGGAADAHAQKVLQDFKKPLPVIEKIPQDQFEAATKLYEEVPMGDKSLAFKVRIDKAWEPVNDAGLSSYTLSNKIFGEVARFYGPPQLTGVRSRFSVQALKLEHQFTAEQWILQYLLTSGYNIQGMESQDNERVEALYVLIEDQVSYVVRAVAQINGKRVVLAQHYLPIELWEQDKVMQAQVTASFSLDNPEKELVENFLKYHFLDIAEVQYPETWQLRAPPLRSIDEMSIEIMNVSGEGNVAGTLALDGKMEVTLISAYTTESLDAAKRAYTAKLEESGLILSHLIETHENFEFNKNFENPVVEVYNATDTKDNLLDYELWLSSMRAGEYYYLFALLTPARDEDFFIWSRNTQTYKIVNALAAPQEESLTEE